ncbi:hypothetical protein ACTTAM_07130 [Rhodobacter capsulatus]|uniref:hypothetical protein n=1 Tax=Rhodobacter capsulatus TaxID=1061 RepID=UPI00402964A4
MDLDRILIDLLSDRIVAELAARRRRGLLVFAATDLGLDAALASLATLARAGWRFEWTAEAALREDLAARLDWPEAAAPVTLSRAALVLVPALSLSLAAKLALGIADDPLSQILTEALDRGRRIVAARDGVCPAARDRLARGLVPATEARRALMREHLQALAAQGGWNWAGPRRWRGWSRAQGRPRPRCRKVASSVPSKPAPSPALRSIWAGPSC